MGKDGLLLGAGLALIAIIAMSKPAAASSMKFRCLYGDNLEFDTLQALQDHVRQQHPGEMIPIQIQW
jgi:hypothetical protein